MAEENSTYDNAEAIAHDDMSVLRILLQSVQGLSPISTAPIVESIPDDNRPHDEQFQFEQ